MTHLETPVSSPRMITREAVIAAYAPLAQQVSHPDALDLSDPQVQAANELFYAWVEQEDARAAAEGGEAEHRANLSKTMLKVDAGFTHPSYLAEVSSEWLPQDAASAEKLPDNPERAETRRLIAEAVWRVRGLLASSPS